MTFKPLLPGPAKVSARAGLFWPAVSLEHSGPEWAVTDTITAERRSIRGSARK
ncbi:MAG: hypothetical protein WDN44_02075 [Sphingomonas sp.]